MTLVRNAAVAALSLAVLSTTAAQAHHSGAMYDSTKLVTLMGTVKAFNWNNPHISIDMVANSGAPTDGAWSIAGSSPGVMGRSGWSSSTVHPGDKITVEFQPLRDGGHGGNIRKLITPDGKELTWAF